MAEVNILAILGIRYIQFEGCGQQTTPMGAFAAIVRLIPCFSDRTWSLV
jgi:hypothetical protein